MLAGWKWIVFGGEMSVELCHFGWWPDRELFDHISSDCIWATFWGNSDGINHCSHFGIKSFLKLAPTWIGNFNKRHFMTLKRNLEFLSIGGIRTEWLRLQPVVECTFRIARIDRTRKHFFAASSSPCNVIMQRYNIESKVEFGMNANSLMSQIKICL